MNLDLNRADHQVKLWAGTMCPIWGSMMWAAIFAGPPALAVIGGVLATAALLVALLV